MMIDDDDLCIQLRLLYLFNYQRYRVFIQYCLFPLKFWIFLNSASSAAALVFYLPFSGPCTQRWKTERGKNSEYSLKFSKKKQLMNTL